MKKVLISEYFLSIEGEGPHTGIPTFYIRTVGCNFKCSGFNNSHKQVINYNKKGFDPVLGFDPAEYKTLAELPPVNIGCDTIYSISDTRFKHLWKKMEWTEILEHCPKNVTTLSLTGGEPSLWQNEIAEFLFSGEADRFERIIFETNGSKDIEDIFLRAIESWADRGREWVWSNSPKMECSGHSFIEAIKPEVISKQRNLIIPGLTQYFKFVTDGSKESIYEILRAVGTYRIYGIPITPNDIYLMPMACTNEQQHQITQKVANLCIENGWRYCHRVQLEVYGNTVGT